VIYGLNSFNGSMCELRGGKPAQSAKDGQRDTMHITLRYTITKNYFNVPADTFVPGDLAVRAWWNSV